MEQGEEPREETPLGKTWVSQSPELSHCFNQQGPCAFRAHGHLRNGRPFPPFSPLPRGPASSSPGSRLLLRGLGHPP